MVSAETLNSVRKASGLIFVRVSENDCCLIGVSSLFWVLKNFRSAFCVLHLNLVNMNSIAVSKFIFLVRVKSFVFFLTEFLNSLSLITLFVLCVKCSNSFMLIYV